jgi:hypothetical protein
MVRKIKSTRILQIFLLVMPFFYAANAIGQVEGCTDPYALNYDPEATWNDGTCFYEETFYIPDQFLELPGTLEESSGIIFWQDAIWSFNDSGGDPKLYKIDTASGTIIQEITISNGTNVDWEDIDQDSDYIYIGDFGNNMGNRKDLNIYKVSKADIPSSGNADVTAGIIAYDYADQDDFTSNPNNNDYDCEAMICVEGNLYLFTKNWVSENSRLYSMSTQPGTYSISPLDTLESNGLVTGASWSEELEQVVLSGYKSYTPFLFLLFDYHDNLFFTGNKRQIMMPGIFGAQTEGICFVQGYEGFLSCENSVFNQKVFSFSTATWTDTTLIKLKENSDKLELRLHPNPVSDGQLSVHVIDPVSDTYLVKIYDSSGKVAFSTELNAPAGQKEHNMAIDIPALNPGVYIFHILSGKMYARESIIVQ